MRSQSDTSEILPANATQSACAVPRNHSSFRVPNTVPNTLLLPLVRNLGALAIFVQINNGRPTFINYFQRAPNLHPALRLLPTDGKNAAPSVSRWLRLLGACDVDTWLGTIKEPHL